MDYKFLKLKVRKYGGEGLLSAPLSTASGQQCTARGCLWLHLLLAETAEKCQSVSHVGLQNTIKVFNNTRNACTCTHNYGWKKWEDGVEITWAKKLRLRNKQSVEVFLSSTDCKIAAANPVTSASSFFYVKTCESIPQIHHE